MPEPLDLCSSQLASPVFAPLSALPLVSESRPRRCRLKIPIIQAGLSWLPKSLPTWVTEPPRKKEITIDREGIPRWPRARRRPALVSQVPRRHRNGGTNGRDKMGGGTNQRDNVFSLKKPPSKEHIMEQNCPIMKKKTWNRLGDALFLAL